MGKEGNPVNTGQDDGTVSRRYTLPSVGGEGPYLPIQCFMAR